MISGIILSTGASFHNGIAPALPKIEETTFLRHIVDVLRSARVIDIVIVINAEENETAKDLSWFDGKIAVNPSWKTGELSSIRAGLDNVSPDDLHGVMVCPIDHPLITQKLLVNLLQSFWKSKKIIIIPIYNGTRGHPIIYGTKLFEALRSAPQGDGVRGVIQNHQNEIHEAQTDEQGTILTISSMDEYEKYSGVLKNA